MATETQTEPRALDFVGGFEGYQNFLYSNVVEGLKKLNGYELACFEKVLRQTRGLVGGLKDGLLALIADKKYLTSRNVEDFVGPLEFDPSKIMKGVVIPDEQRPYWEKKASGTFSTGPKTTPELYIYLKLGVESDKIIRQKQEAV